MCLIQSTRTEETAKIVNRTIRILSHQLRTVLSTRHEGHPFQLTILSHFMGPRRFDLSCIKGQNNGAGFEAVNRSPIDTPSGPSYALPRQPAPSEHWDKGLGQDSIGTRTKLGQNSTGVDTPAQHLSYSSWSATSSLSRCAPWGRGRATGMRPIGRPARARRWNKCGRRRPGADFTRDLPTESGYHALSC
jgi:hypothetical protein